MKIEDFEFELQCERNGHFRFVPIKVKRTQTKVFGIYSLQYMNHEISKYTIENGEVFTNISDDALLKLKQDIDTDIKFKEQSGWKYNPLSYVYKL